MGRITYDDYLRMKLLIHKGVGYAKACREVGVSKRMYYAIKHRKHYYDTNPLTPTPPPPPIVHSKSSISPLSPEYIPHIKTTLLSLIEREEEILLSTEDLMEARRHGFIDDEGNITLRSSVSTPDSDKFLLNSTDQGGIYNPPPPENGHLERLNDVQEDSSTSIKTNSQSSPTIRELISPGYYDKLLDEEVREEKQLRTTLPPSPPSNNQDKIPPHLEHRYGRCPTCGGYVYLPCWECFIRDLLEPQ